VVDAIRKLCEYDPANWSGVMSRYNATLTFLMLADTDIPVRVASKRNRHSKRTVTI
jgi:hypothetical protein